MAVRSRWWRAYDEALHDPKLIALPDNLFRAWFLTLCLASKNNGFLPAVGVVAIELRCTKLKAELIISNLLARGLLDRDEDKSLICPHNWKARQYKSDVSTERVKRFRNAKRNVSETPPETETETETEKKVPAPDGAFDNLDVEVVNEDPKARLFRLGKPILISFGITEKRTGSLIGQWLKAKPDPLGILAALQFARNNNVAEPIAYVSAIIHGKAKNGGVNGNDRRPGESLGDFARRLAADARELEDSARAHRANEPFGGH